MAKATTKVELLDEISAERHKLDELLRQIPEDDKLVPVVDGMSVKDLLAHRAEWARMTMGWYEEARSGGSPAIPSSTYTWRQLPELNAEIQRRFADMPLEAVEKGFAESADRLRTLVEEATEDELFQSGVYPFTKSTTLAAYVTSATAAHYRSAHKHIRRWWRARG